MTNRSSWALLIVIAVECAVFGITGHNFLTITNAFEITRLSVELGLLALALTPIIITGGIDLSVGSMMGLAAVVLGMLWHDAGWSLPLACLCALLTGLAGGALNALLIARLGLPPLIVTLGTYSLFRGIAEGLTRGIAAYSSFPASFLYLGQGYIGGVIPTQFIILVLAAVALAWGLHETAWGRTLYAIGLAPEGARYAGVPVRRRLGGLYVMSGVAASLAAVIYVAHIGQAKADAGTGYELTAITAVVLGGASIFGGRGTILGTILGLLALVMLQNGLRLSAQPSELAGVLTGVLLIATIMLDRLTRQSPHTRPVETTDTDGEEETEMKNSQLAVLSGAVVGAALLVAASNWSVANAIRDIGSSALVGAGRGSGVADAGSRTRPSFPSQKLTIAMMPKAKGDPYFISARAGADSAAAQLGVDLLWDGPTDLDPAKQNEVVEAWITRGVDAIAVSVENKAAISTVLRKARDHGIKVVTWDADADTNARDFFVNQATPQGIGYTLTDEAARIMHNEGDFAIITASLTAANQNEWITYIKQRLADKYPNMHLVAIQPSDGDRDRAFAETQTVLHVHPEVKVIMGIAAPAVPGAAEAVAQSGRTDVKVTGLSLPNMCRPYIKSGVIESIVLWNTAALGALTVRVADAVATGQLKRGDQTFDAGPLGNFAVVNDEVRLGSPFVFNKSNIDQFNF